MIVNLTDDEVEYIKHCLGLANIAICKLSKFNTPGQELYLLKAGTIAINTLLSIDEAVCKSTFEKFYPKTERLTEEEFKAFKRRFENL